MLDRALLLVLCWTALLAAACGPAPAGRRPQQLPTQPEIPPELREAAAARWDSVSDGFMQWYLQEHPVRATRLGVHDYDGALPDLTRSGIRVRTDTLLYWLGHLQRLNPVLLEGGALYDHRVMEFAIRSELLDLEEIRWWEQNPMLYGQVIADGLASLAEREYEPVDDRMRALLSRMDQIPRVTAAARENLRNPPRLWAEIAARNARASARFIRDGLWPALESQGADTVSAFFRDQFDTGRRQAASDVEAYADWIESSLLPTASGRFRLGRHMFERKVRYDEHFALTVEELDRLNEEAIAEYQEWVARVAAEIDPTRSPREIMDSITGIYPEPDELLDTARGYMTELQDFVRANEIVTLPADELPVVRETPEWQRLGFASLDAPGPFEEASLRAFFNITNVDPDWTDEQKRQHLTYFNYPGLLGVAIHEAMPGHFVQLTYERQIESDIRRAFTPPSFVEGWAHYAEQMLLDEGFADQDPAVRLGQLRRALQRHARWYAGLHMHAFDASIDELTRRFMEIAYFPEFPARREVERATYDPTYLYYALGRMRILQLREDYREYLEGRDEEFSLQAFHDRLLELGLPIPLARDTLIPGRAPAGSN